MVLDAVAQARLLENRDCPEYPVCFDRAVEKNQIAVPCRTCDKNPKEPKMPKVSRTDLLEAVEHLLNRDGVATAISIANFLGTSDAVVHLLATEMERAGLLVITRPPRKGGGQKNKYSLPAPDAVPQGAMGHSTVPHSTPSHDTVERDTPKRPEPISLANGEKLRPEVAAAIREKLDAPLPDKAVEVHQIGEKAGIVQETEEKAKIVQSVQPVTLTEVLMFEADQLEAKGLPEHPAKMCKKHPGAPARLDKLGRSTGFCDGCLAERGRQVIDRNRVGCGRKPKARPQGAGAPELSAEEFLFQWTLKTLPPFDPTWTQEVWRRWQDVWNYLWDIARDLDGVEREGPVSEAFQGIWNRLDEITEKLGVPETQ